MQIGGIETRQQLEGTDSHWTEHIKTLMAYELQFVSRLRPLEGEEPNVRRGKRRKNIEFESAFLFAGRKQNKKIESKVEQMIANSHCDTLKRLFNKTQRNFLQQKKEGMRELKKMVKIMLELKHSSIMEQFLQLYEEIVKRVEKITFKSIEFEEKRLNEVRKIAQDITNNVIRSKSNQQHFKQLASYMKHHEKQTLQFVKVSVYCFLAEIHNFNINEFYWAAFTLEQDEKKVPKKKRKMQ